MAQIKSIHLRNFKAHKQLSAYLRDINVFVGPNNAGKSTILDGLRAMAGALRFARTRVPQMIAGVEGRLTPGFVVPRSSVPINLSNLRTNYSDEETSIEIQLQNGNKLTLLFKENDQVVLCLDAKTKVKNTIDFKEQFPLKIRIVPTLGPFEEEEELLNTEYVSRYDDTRRAHRMFRNIWYRRSKKEFEELKSLVEDSWPGTSILAPEFDAESRRVNMFSKDGRIDREIAWSGFGFQIWLQILTHLVLAKEDNVLIVDEPEIYLHPDLQHRLMSLLKKVEKQVLLATHSAEVINEADQDDVLIVEKDKKVARRVTDIEGLQNALFSIGSAQNIHLARLSKGKKVLFFEGKDFKVVRKLAEKLGLERLASGLEITIVPIEGFSNWKRVENTAWAFEQVLQTEISIASLFDRDYRCSEEVDSFLRELRKKIENCFVLEQKEIENYLLIPTAIAKAIHERLKARGEHLIQPLFDLEVRVTSLLYEITDEIKHDVVAQLNAHRLRFLEKSGTDSSTIIRDSYRFAEAQWASLENRLKIVPGKQTMSELNSRLQLEYGISITEAAIIRNASKDEISPELTSILKSLEKF